jgi:hypothetical protein
LLPPQLFQLPPQVLCDGPGSEVGSFVGSEVCSGSEVVSGSEVASGFVVNSGSEVASGSVVNSGSAVLSGVDVGPVPWPGMIPGKGGKY